MSEYPFAIWMTDCSEYSDYSDYSEYSDQTVIPNLYFTIGILFSLSVGPIIPRFCVSLQKKKRKV